MFILARPFDQGTHGFGLGRSGIGVEHQHAMGLQALRAVNRQQPHRARIGAPRSAHARPLHRPHKRIGREVATAIELQGRSEQRAQIGQHRVALRDHAGRCKARVHVGVFVDRLQGVVRRQYLHQTTVFEQAHRSGLQRR